MHEHHKPDDTRWPPLLCCKTCRKRAQRASMRRVREGAKGCASCELRVRSSKGHGGGVRQCRAPACRLAPGEATPPRSAAGARVEVAILAGPIQSASLRPAGGQSSCRICRGGRSFRRASLNGPAVGPPPTNLVRRNGFRAAGQWCSRLIGQRHGSTRPPRFQIIRLAVAANCVRGRSRLIPASSKR